MFKFAKPNKYYEYETYNNSDEKYFKIGFNPLDPLGRPKETQYRRKYWNVKLFMSHQTFQKFPERLTKLLKLCDWYIRRMDFAFDFNCNITRHFTLVEGRTKVTDRHKDEDTDVLIEYRPNYYLYSNSNRKGARIYNKKKELLDKRGIEIEDEHLMRFEIIVKPSIIKQSPLRCKDFTLINQYLDEFNGCFIPRLHDLKGELTGKELDLLYNIMRRKKKKRLKSEAKQFAKIRPIIEKHAFNFSSHFAEQKDVLFTWIPEK